MSAELSKTPQTGFLRDFHFSTLADVVLTELFGEILQPGWMTFTVGHAPAVETQSFVFTIDVCVEPHSRSIVLNDRTVPFRFDRRKALRFTFPLDGVVVEYFRSDVPKLFVEWLSKTLRENAYRLYEFDPRIGWISGGSNKGLPVSPLFDPPEDFSRTGLPMEGKDGRSLESSCAFCGEGHTMSESPVWGGANMMWLHQRCWRVPS